MNEIHIMKFSEMGAYLEANVDPEDIGAVQTNFFEKDGEKYVALRILEQKELDEINAKTPIIDLREFFGEMGSLEIPEDSED